MFALTEAQQKLQQEARTFADEVIAPLAEATDRNKAFPREQMKALAERGWCGVLAPKDLGGLGLGNLELTLIGEQINRACASTGVTFSVHNSLATSPMIRHASDEQKRRYLPRLASGEWIGAYALTEAEAGSDAASLRCKAVRDGDDYVLEGSKLFITTGSEADFFILFARTDPDLSKKAKGISAFLVEKTYPGFSAGAPEAKLGIRGSVTNELNLADVRVPASNRLGEEGQGFRIAMDTLDGGRIGIGTQSLGIAQAALDALHAWALERAGGDARKVALSVQWRMSEIYARVEAARLLVYRAAHMRDLKAPHNREAATAKLFASGAANDIAREVVQAMGMDGVRSGNAASRLVRDARITEIYEGTTEIQKLVIARHILS